MKIHHSWNLVCPILPNLVSLALLDFQRRFQKQPWFLGVNPSWAAGLLNEFQPHHHAGQLAITILEGVKLDVARELTQSILTGHLHIGRQLLDFKDTFHRKGFEANIFPTQAVSPSALFQN